MLTDSISGKPFVYVAGGKDLKTLSGNAVLAYSPENKNGRAVLFADGRVELVANGKFCRADEPQRRLNLPWRTKSNAKNLRKQPSMRRCVAATPPPAQLVSGELEMQKSGATASQAFAQTAAANQQNLYRNVSTAAQTAPVLQSFQVLQNGDAISVVDRDGSVYQGSVQVAAAAERKEPAQRRCLRRSSRATGSQTKRFNRPRQQQRQPKIISSAWRE